MGYLSVASMAGSYSFIMYVPVLMHGWLTCAQICTEGVSSPYNLILIGPIKKVLDIATTNRAEYMKMKCDIEIYLGIYLTMGWFIGLSQIISVILYL